MTLSHILIELFLSEEKFFQLNVRFVYFQFLELCFID